MPVEIKPEEVQDKIVIDVANGGGLANVDALTIPAPKWCDAGGPANAAAFLKGGGIGKEVWIMRNAAGFFKAGDKKVIIPSWVLAAFGNKFGWIIETFLVWPIYTALQAMDASLAYTVKKCENPGVAKLVLRKGIGQILERWIGPSIDVEPSPAQYTINFACPTVIPIPDTFVQRWLDDEMDAGTVQDWCKANGWCEYTTQIEMAARQYKPGIGDVVARWYKGTYKSEDELIPALRKCGVVNEDRAKSLIEQNRYRLSAGEVIALHYRTPNADLAVTINRLKQAGVTQIDEALDLIELGKPLLDIGTIYRQLHLLRPGRGPADLTYTVDDAYQDILRLGYTEKQAARLLYMEKTVLGLRQLLTPYYDGWMNAEQLYAGLRDNGLADEDIPPLLPFWEFERKQKFAAAAGAPQSKELVSGLAAGDMNVQEFGDQMDILGYAPAVTAFGIAEAAERRKRNIRSAGIASISAGMKTGEISETDALNALNDFGVGADAAAMIVREWQIDFGAKHKPASIGQLCEWFSNGWLTFDEYAERLGRYGYGKADIARIVKACDLKLRVKNDKAVQRAKDRYAKSIEDGISLAAKIGKSSKSLKKELDKYEEGKVGSPVPEPPPEEPQPLEDTIPQEDSLSGATAPDSSGTP